MAFTFPLSAAQFCDLLPIKEMTFELGEAFETSETGSGELLTADLGTRLWKGEVQLGDMEPDEADDALGLLDVLRRAGGSFMMYDRARPWPRADWRGAGLAWANPVLHTVAASMREIRIDDLGPNYQLKRRDALAYPYGIDPTRFALHRLAAPVTTSAAGLTPLVEVVPNIRAGFTIGVAVTLLKASCKAIIVPGSLQPGRRKGRLTTGASFRWQQTLR